MFKPSTDHAHVRTIVNMMAELPTGGAITFDEMTSAIGVNVLTKRYIMLAAIREFNKEAGAVMASVRGVGYVRLTAEQYAAAIAARRGRVGRLARRTHKTFSRALERANDMAPQELIKIGRELAMIGLIGHIARDSVAAKAPVGEKPPSYAATAKAMLEAMKAA